MSFIKVSVMLVLALAASSCGAPAVTRAPLTLEDLQGTSMAGAFTALAETHAALPTNTRVPPSATPTQTAIPSNTSEVPISSHTAEASPIPSSTPQASPTSAPSFTPTFTALPKNQLTLTLQPTALGNDPCNKPLTSWQGPSTKIMIRHEYKPQGKNDKVILSLWVMSDMKECGFIPSLSTGPVGQYSAVAFIDGEKDFKVYGGFRLTEGSWEIIIRNDIIVAKGGCYPNC
ncbi:MAG TPA: hypothetical protein VFR47_13425 [Anaerolineales bacterium]|nr:hypothetical protein [Anaerolineales bacterium]